MKSASLFTKTLLFMVVVFGIIATATSFISSWQLQHHLTLEYTSKAKGLAQSMAESDLELLLNNDVAAIQSRIDQYLTIEGVSHVVVADEHGNIVAHTFVPVVPESVQAMMRRLGGRELGASGLDDPQVMQDGRFLHVTHPILNGLAGYVHIGMDGSLIKDYIRSAVIRQQGMTLLVFLACVLLSWAFINNISKPLNRLQEYARRVAIRDYDAQIDIDSEGEIGELASTMTAMAGEINELVGGLEYRVRSATEELQRAKDELEVKVEERTSELSRANIQLKIEIAERRVVGEALKKTEQKYRSIFENAVEGIFQVSQDGYYISANPAMARIFGFNTPAEFMATVNGGEQEFYLDMDERSEYMIKLAESGAVKNHVSQIRRADGKVIWVSEHARRVTDVKGQTMYFEGSLEDITLRKVAEEQLVHQAFHDPLTGLPNRVLFMDHLRMAMERSKRRDNYLYAVLYLDLDRFKIINDSLGHDIGDSLLKVAAGVLEKCGRTVDTVARFGGDEFAVLLEEITAPRDAIKFAKRILSEMSKPFDLEGNEVFTSASIGIVLHTEKYNRPESLLRDADTAMYRAKELGKARFKVFNQRMHEQAIELMELETDLRRAIDNVELHAEYQPIVALEDFSVSGFEVLVRWPHPTQGLIMPDSFIPLAEDTGLIYSIDFRVIEQACERVRRWRESMEGKFFDADPPMTVNLNLSGKHFKQPHLLQQVERIVRSAKLPPQVLNLEITESALMENPSAAGDLLMRLKEFGVGLSIDDFGTGYSSLSYLQRFPIDVVKIDRTFVAGVEDDRDSRAIVRTIISLGLSLGHKVVAEGVENQDQLEFLLDAGCQYAQGYLFSKPVSEDEVENILRSGGILDPTTGNR